MQEKQDLIAQMGAVTISREYGSGGGEIASRLARRLQWQLIDHEVVIRVAQEMGISEDEAVAHDEHADSLMVRMLSSITLVEPGLLAGGMPNTILRDEQAYQEALRRVVTAAAAKRHVVIIGRGSQVLLAGKRDVLHVRVVAPFAQRVTYVMRRENLDRVAAERRIHSKERDRSRYLQLAHHQHPEDPHLYDLVVNTAILDLDSIVDMIIQALQHKAERLTTPEAELGPVAGLTRYPGRPQDIRPPAAVEDRSENAG